MTEFTFNGKTYNTEDYVGNSGFGYNDPIQAGTGDTLPRHIAAMADLLADASRARQTTSPTSKNAGLTGSQSWVLAEDIPFAIGAFVTVARASAPTTTHYVIQVTGYDSNTKTLTGTVIRAEGSGGPYTDWVVSVAGAPGKTSVKVTQATRDVSLASGMAAVTGIGFQPRAAAFVVAENNGEFSIGFSDGTDNRCVYRRENDGKFQVLGSACLVFAPSNTDYNLFSVASWDADGLTLNITKAGSPTGTASIIMLCLR